MFETIQTGNPAERPPTRYDDQEYSRILDGIVITCADIVVIDPDGKILMLKRAYEPAKDVYWIIGGRMRFGESFEQAAARNLRREMKLDLSPDRFVPLGTYNYIWGQRAQKPMENGSQTVSITHAVFLSRDEIRRLQPNEEYNAETMIWRDPKEVLLSETDHPAMIQTVIDLANFLQKSKHFLSSLG